MDIFCEAKQKLKDVIIAETENFILLHDGFPLAEGHLFMIPRRHEDCFLDIGARYEGELNTFISLTCRFLRENYVEPVLFEHGVIAQTVPHAHLHFLPTRVSIEATLSGVASVMVQPRKPYLYYRIEHQGLYFKPEAEIPPGFLHATYAAALGRPVNTADRADKTVNWTSSVRRKWQAYVPS